MAPWSARRATWIVRGIGIAAALALAGTLWLGLWVTPPDQVQHNLVRLVYIHPPIAWVALYLAFGVAAGSSVLWLWPRTRSRFWDRLAVSAVEVGIVFTALTLVTGSIWGRPTWGVWWAWDARLTSTALLLVLLLGYMAVRRVPADPDSRARRSAVVALVAAVDVPIVHFSVDWWHTLHQGATVLNANLSPTIHGSMAWTLLLGFVAFTLLFAWMLAIRYRVEVLSEQLQDSELDVALHERWAEGKGPGHGSWREPWHDADAGHESGRHELYQRRLRHRLRRVVGLRCGPVASAAASRAIGCSRPTAAPAMTEPTILATPSVVPAPGTADGQRLGAHRTPRIAADAEARAATGGGCGASPRSSWGPSPFSSSKVSAARSITSRPSIRLSPTRRRSAPRPSGSRESSSPGPSTASMAASPSWRRAPSTRVDVVNHGNPPQLFQPDVPVVVVGHFAGTSFVSDQLIVDHSAQYVQAHPNRVKAPNGTTR